jgi:hypothetical protein
LKSQVTHLLKLEDPYFIKIKFQLDRLTQSTVYELVVLC